METKQKSPEEVHAIVMNMIAESTELTIEDMELITIESRPKPDFLNNRRLHELYGYTSEQIRKSIDDSVLNLRSKKRSELEAEYHMYNCEAFRLYAVDMMLKLSEASAPVKTSCNIVDYIINLPEPIKTMVLVSIKSLPTP